MKDLLMDLAALDVHFGSSELASNEFKTQTSRFESQYLAAETSFSSDNYSQPSQLIAPDNSLDVQVGSQDLQQTKFQAKIESADIVLAEQFDEQAALINQTIPYVVVNDAVGGSGSRDLAAPLDSVVAISNGQGAFCTGTLIAPDLVLSARHCDISEADSVVFGDNYNTPDLTVGIEQVTLPAGPGSILDGGDVALLRLNSPVSPDVAEPIPLLAQTASLVGTEFTLVGYGDNGIGSGQVNSADGYRWAGKNVIDFYGTFGGADNLFLADFDDGTEFGNMLDDIGSSPTPVDLEAIVFPGDSGSPLLIETTDGLAIAGVTTGGLYIATHPYGAFAYWTGIANFQQQFSDAGASFVGSGGGSNGELPGSDDHGDNDSDGATTLQFQMGNNSAIARKTGVVGYAGFSSDVDRFAFEKTSDGRLIVDVKATSDLDTFVEVFDANGTLLGQNDNFENANPTANPSDSRVFLRNIPAGEYFVAVTSTNDTTGSYRLAVRSNVDTSDAGDTFGTSQLFTTQFLPSTTFVRSSIQNGVDVDYFRFRANATGEIVVRTKALSGNLNTVLRGFNANQSLLEANNNYRDSLNSRISFNVVSGETYFLKLNSVGSSQGDYRISLRMPNGQGNGTFSNAASIGAIPDQSFATVDQYGANNSGMLAAGI